MKEEGKLQDSFLEDIKVKNNDDILAENINWIIRKMISQKLIRIFGDTISLTPLGMKRARKLQKSKYIFTTLAS